MQTHNQSLFPILILNVHMNCTLKTLALTSDGSVSINTKKKKSSILENFWHGNRNTRTTNLAVNTIYSLRKSKKFEVSCSGSIAKKHWLSLQECDDQLDINDDQVQHIYKRIGESFRLSFSDEGFTCLLKEPEPR